MGRTVWLDRLDWQLKQKVKLFIFLHLGPIANTMYHFTHHLNQNRGHITNKLHLHRGAPCQKCGCSVLQAPS